MFDLLLLRSKLKAMTSKASSPPSCDLVTFSTKGQIVIPRWMREAMGLKSGLKAMVRRQGDEVVITPITPRRIASLRGILKGTGVLESLMEDRRKERQRR